MNPILSKIQITEDLQRMDFAFIHGFLTTSYWSEGISKVRMQRAMENSINIGVFLDDKQVAYARVVTDHSTFAHLCDVFVAEQMRGKGISKKMMEYILALPALQGIRKFTLGTRDAHGLYAQFGWKPLEMVERYMEINRPGIYKTLHE